MEHTVSALVHPHNVATGANPETAIVNRTGNIVRSETARTQQEVMGPAVSALVISNDLALRVDRGVRSEKVDDRTWRINHSESSCALQVDMSVAIASLEISHDVTFGIDFGK